MVNNEIIIGGELKHHGVKGMKWGVRRYQNTDGTLTNAGKKRYDRDVRENNAKKKDNRMNIDGPDPDRWVKEDISRTKKTVDASSDMVRQMQKIERDLPTKKPNIDLSNMSDQQMRSEINRAMLERQYADMVAARNVSRGREFAKKTLEYSGIALSMTGTALGIALAIKELSG